MRRLGSADSHSIAFAVASVLTGAVVLASLVGVSSATANGQSQVISAAPLAATPPNATPLDAANWWRGFAGLYPSGASLPNLVLDSGLSQGARNHTAYLASIHDQGSRYCGHGTDPAFPPPADVERGHNILFCGLRGADAVHGWARTPYHGLSFFNPAVSGFGYGEASASDGLPSRLAAFSSRARIRRIRLGRSLLPMGRCLPRNGRVEKLRIQRLTAHRSGRRQASQRSFTSPTPARCPAYMTSPTSSSSGPL